MGSRENSQSEEVGTRVHRVLGMLERSAIQGLVVPGSHESNEHIVLDSKLALGQKLRCCRMNSSLLLSKVTGIKKERDTQNSTSGKGVSSIKISSQVLAWSMAVKDHIQNLLRKVQV